MKTILIVEDNELNRDLLVQLLEDDYRIVTANDGELAASDDVTIMGTAGNDTFSITGTAGSCPGPW